MIFCGVIGLPKSAVLITAALGQRFRIPTVQVATLQWLQWPIVGVVGIVLGSYVLAISSWPIRWASLLVLAALFPFALMILGNVRRVLLAIIILDIPLQLDIYLGYRSEVAELGAFGGINISITAVALTILYAMWVSGLLVGAGSQPRLSLRSSFPLALYLGFVTLSLATARDVTLSLFQVFFLWQMFLLFVYIAASVRTRQDVTFIVNVLLICLAFESLIMIGMYLTGQGLNIAGISANTEAGFGRRVGGTLYSPNNAAAYLSLLLVPAVSLLLTNSERWIKRLAGFGFGLGIVALTLTLSRGGMLALLLSGTILYLGAWRRGWFSPSMRVAVIMVAGLLALILYIFVFSTVSRDEGGRLILIELAFRMIEDHPWFGVGANNFVLLIQQYVTPDIGNAWLYTVHSMYLLVWAETGIVGLFTFVFFLAITIQRGWQCWKLQHRFLSPLALGFTAAIIGHMSHMFFDFFNDRPNIQLLWLIAGLIVAMNKIAAGDMSTPYRKIAQLN
jgi:O-antigen ligase